MNHSVIFVAKVAYTNGNFYRHDWCRIRHHCELKWWRAVTIYTQDFLFRLPEDECILPSAQAAAAAKLQSLGGRGEAKRATILQSILKHSGSSHVFHAKVTGWNPDDALALIISNSRGIISVFNCLLWWTTMIVQSSLQIPDK